MFPTFPPRSVYCHKLLISKLLSTFGKRGVLVRPTPGSSCFTCGCILKHAQFCTLPTMPLTMPSSDELGVVACPSPIQDEHVRFLKKRSPTLNSTSCYRIVSSSGMRTVMFGRLFRGSATNIKPLLKLVRGNSHRHPMPEGESWTTPPI